MARSEYNVNVQITEYWTIDRVETYWYWSGRNDITYKEITFWYDPSTCERKETVRSASALHSEKYNLPEWAKCITNHNKSMDYEYV